MTHFHEGRCPICGEWHHEDSEFCRQCQDTPGVIEKYRAEMRARKNTRLPTKEEPLLLRVLAEIREALGVGHKPMLSDLPGIVREKMAELGLAEMAAEENRRGWAAANKEAQAAHARVDKLMADLADTNEGLTAAYMKGVADQRDETRKVEAENKKLRRVVVAYLAKEEASEEARPEWSSADPTPQACIKWSAKMDALDAELQAALLDSGMVYPIKA